MSTTLPREISLPFRVDGAGRVAFTTDIAEMTRHHVFSAVGTNEGERVMRGDYGTRLMEHLFDSISNTNLGSLESDIMQSLATNCPEANVTGIDITPDIANGAVSVTVRFMLANDVEQTANVTTKLPTA